MLSATLFTLGRQTLGRQAIDIFTTVPSLERDG